MSFELDRALLPSQPASSGDPVEVDGHRFERPTTRHLARIADAAEPGEAARRLLHDCAECAERLPRDGIALDDLQERVEAALDEAEPWADVAVALTCPDCGHPSEASFDIAAYLWEELDAHAHGLLDDIHVLATAYGWHEPQILALSPARRAAYLARVLA